VRVGIDYRPATTHWPGSGRYARELVRALVALRDRPDLGLYDVGRAPRSVDPRALGLPVGDPGVRRTSCAIPRRALPWLARAGFDAARMLGGVDVFHHVNASGPPVRRAREVLAVAELPARGSDARRELAERARRMAAIVVFCSDWRAHAAEELDFPIERIHTTSVGCEHWRRALPALPGPDDPPRVLVLGATRAERRPLAILRAFELLRAGGVEARLVYAGREGDAENGLAAAVRSCAHAAHVERIRDPREADLPELVARSSALVHLDPDAGTPVTPLEALAAGVPVVASRIPCFVEHLEGVAELVDDEASVHEPALLAAAIATAIAARSDAAALGRRTARAGQHTWARCAAETIAAWRAVASRA